MNRSPRVLLVGLTVLLAAAAPAAAGMVQQKLGAGAVPKVQLPTVSRAVPDKVAPPGKGDLPEVEKAETPALKLAPAGGTAPQKARTPVRRREKGRNSLLADVGRMPAGQKFQLGDRQLSRDEFVQVLQRLEKDVVPLRKGTAGALRSEIEAKQTGRVVAANRLIMDSIRQLESKEKSANIVIAPRGMAKLVVLAPRVDSIWNQQPAYSPGMYIVIRGAHFNTYSYEKAGWGGITTAKAPPSALITYKRGKNKTESTSLLEVITEGQFVSTPELLLAKFPDDLGGIIDQKVRLHVEAGPPDDRRKSGEVEVAFVAKRVVKELKAGDVICFFCNNVFTSSGGCDHEGEFATSWSLCGNFTYNAATMDVVINGATCGPARQFAYGQVKGWPFRTLHEGRCLYGQDSFDGADLYQIPLYNKHEVSGYTQGSGGDGVAVPVYHGTAVDPVNRLLEFDFSINQGGAVMWYGFSVQVVGPAGVPYNEDWGQYDYMSAGR
jgi:hypothetical protein